MINVFKRELKSNFKALLIWASAMFLMGLIGFGEYGIIMVGDSNVDMGVIIDMMPRVVQVMFGMGTLSVNTPEGWYVCMFLWCALIAFLHAALLGANIISKEESDKTSEFLYTKPIKRNAVITGKIFAAVIYIAAVVFACWVSIVLVFNKYIKDTDLYADIPLTLLGMFLTSLIFFFIGLFMSAVFTVRGKAAQYSAITVVAAYLISVMIEMVGNIDYLSFISPFRYFDAVRILDKGIEPLYVVLSTVIILVTGYFTYFLYGMRNLHS